MTAIPLDWRRGLRGRFLSDVTRRTRAGSASWSAGGVARGWRFNLSAGQHLSLTDSGRHLIVAVGRGVPIGIDAERLRPVDDPVATLERLGLALLAARLAQLAPAPRQRAFAHVWTAFEAFLKLERLPWEIAAERFSRLQKAWRIAIDGTASFVLHGEPGVTFQPIYAIPSILLTIATPIPCQVITKSWECGRLASLEKKPAQR